MDEDQLGPFGAMWLAWNDVSAEIKSKPLSHFERAVNVQFDELAQHLARNDREAAAREAIDIVSIALNCLRWLGYQPDEVADLTRLRAERRMQGQVSEILEKYRRDYGI